MGAVENPSAEPALAPAAAMPTPGFEGFEKRLEVEFFANDIGLGLRTLPRAQIDSMLTAAECTIVSQLSSDLFDSYILSESSLFIYPHRIVLKTCGTTQLLKAIPKLLDAAFSIGLRRVIRCKYTRGSFLFPEVQPFPHRSFDEEVCILEEHFGRFNNSKYFVMGNGRQKWHVYVASEKMCPAEHNTSIQADCANYTLEVCMTELDKSATTNFFKSGSIVTGDDMTKASGINLILPGSQICDFAFDPCGYSMNGMEGGAHSTIHITPEDGFSYASFESMGYDPAKTDLNALIDRVIKCFKPGFVSVSVSAAPTIVGDSGKAVIQNSISTSSTWERSLYVPAGYFCNGSHREELPGGGAVVYHTFRLLASGLSASVQVKSLSVAEQELKPELDEELAVKSDVDVDGFEGENLKQDKLSNNVHKPLIGSLEGAGFILLTRAELLKLLRDQVGSPIEEFQKNFSDEEGDDANAAILIVAKSGKLLTETAASGKFSRITTERTSRRLGSRLNQLMQILEEEETLAVLSSGE